MKKFELRPCPDCGCADPRWCGISHRPYCPDCGKWGAINFGSDLDAVNAWNKPNQLEKLQAQNDIYKTALQIIASYDEDSKFGEGCCGHRKSCIRNITIKRQQPGLIARCEALL